MQVAAAACHLQQQQTALRERQQQQAGPYPGGVCANALARLSLYLPHPV